MRLAHQLFLAAVTVYMEAGNQPRAGKLAVAYVIANRARLDRSSATDVIFRKFQFSCWLTGSNTLMQLDDAPDAVIDECLDVMHVAWNQTGPDPTNGATHYLNEVLTRKIRADGTLPAWFDEEKVTSRIGEHTFLRLA